MICCHFYAATLKTSTIFISRNIISSKTACGCKDWIIRDFKWHHRFYLTNNISNSTRYCSSSYGNNTMSQDAIPDNRQLIQEGSAKMLYPKGVVFYNPVQVQNRDLSLVMMQLFAERRVKRVILKSKRKEFMKAAREAAVNCGEKNKQVVDIEAVEQQVRDYDEKTNWKDVYDNYEGKGIRILDALAASGLRSIRYFNEISPSLLHSVTINDLDAAAVDLAKENIEFNNLSHVLLTLDEESKGDKRGLVVVNNDATHLMYTSRRTPGLHQISPILAMQKDQYDVIDLDPYGSAAPFLDAAVQAVTNGGMLAITCTDMAALGGSHADTCYGRYCSMTIPRAGYLQELALRILLSNIAQRAAVYGRSMRPILSVGMHFYVRVFVEIWDDKAAVNNLSLDIGTVYQSTQCPSFHTVSHGQHAQKNQNVIQATRAPRVPCCEETGGPFKTAGPCWLGPMHNIDVVQEAIARLEPLNDVKKKEDLFGYLKQDRELHGLLTVCSEELPDAPLYYVLPKLSHTLGCSTPPIDKFKSALINAGYRVSGYHKEAQAIKTNAPNSVVWDIMRAWCKENPPNPKSKNKQNKTKKQKRNRNGESCEDDILNVEEQDNNEAVDGEKTELSPSEKILAVEPTIAVDFTLTREVKNKTKALRFPMNPEANWGPKKAASGYKRKVDENDEGND